ncbi:MAG TPA: ABC transporter substrate-binding protein [Acidimicrobiales bacterium]|nr:ABC transporter substrate-binding protein [Acidimicrobiales bacterium]
MQGEMGMGPKLRMLAIVGALAIVAAGCTGAKRPGEGVSLATGDATTTTSAPSDDIAAVDGTAPGPDASPAPGGAAPTVPGGAATKAGAAAGSKTSTKPGTSGASTASGAATSTGGSTSAAAPVDAPGDPQLFAGDLNVRGISSTEVRLCGHAALTYGPAFNASEADFNVYYSAVNDAGGVFGRKITATYENDDYKPATAVQAAEACKAKNPFMILGGIGFDQIPGVRNWAEQNKELYFHHIATVKGSEGKQYSYTTQPTVERVGEAFGQLAAQKFKGKKIGILYRNSEFWQPGFDAFKQVANERGLTIVGAIGVQQNQAEYTQALLALKSAGAEVVWGWENTLALTQMVEQAKAQNWSPIWLAFPFNLTAQALGEDAMTPPMVGLASWPGYSFGDYAGTFSSYAADMKEFEAQYKKYRPNTDIAGVAGDLLWLNWVEQKRLVALLKACGQNCTRNHLVGLLQTGYKATVGPTCPLDFSGGKHDGSGGLVNTMETYRSPSGKVNWRSIELCKADF